MESEFHLFDGPHCKYECCVNLSISGDLYKIFVLGPVINMINDLSQNSKTNFSNAFERHHTKRGIYASANIVDQLAHPCSLNFLSFHYLVSRKKMYLSDVCSAKTQITLCICTV